MKKFLTFVLVSLSIHLTSQTYVFIPDVNFRTYLQNTVPTAMNGNSLDINNPLITSTIATMNVMNSNIADLTGVQYFTSLAVLFCDHNLLTSLPPLPNTLVDFTCDYNKLSSLPTLPSSLQSLSCSNNSLTTLPALPNNIYYFLCRDNKLTNLPPLPDSLQSLLCENNLLTALPALPSKLFNLWCGGNKLTYIPTLPNSLLQLLCYSNSLTVLPSLPKSLQSLWCDNNSLSSLPTLPDSLLQLLCDYNFLTSLPALPHSLQSLKCESNYIKCFHFFPDSIKQVFVDNNPYTCLPNLVLPAMKDYTATPLCSTGNINGCETAVGIKEIKPSTETLKIFPNPTSGQFMFETTDAEAQSMKVLDLTGKILLEKIINDKTLIDLSNLNEGVYMVMIKTKNNILNEKLIIAR